MAYNRNYHNNNITEDQLVAFLADTLNRVENASDTDIETLNLIKKVFKKAVPFTRRKYVAAWLVKQACANFKGGRFNKDRSNRFEKDNKAESFERKNTRFENNRRDNRENTEKPAERQERAPRVVIDESVAATIFISIGKNRRVFPRDLVGLLVSVAGLERDRIGEIRVLANFSFVQLYAEDAEKVIAALNEYEYRGRKLSVSYSRKGEEKEAAKAESAAPSAPAVDEDVIPANVSNESTGIAAPVSEETKIAQEQTMFAASMSQSTASTEAPFSETTDDGQVKSHFGTGAAY